VPRTRRSASATSETNSTRYRRGERHLEESIDNCNNGDERLQQLRQTAVATTTKNGICKLRRRSASGENVNCKRQGRPTEAYGTSTTTATASARKEAIGICKRRRRSATKGYDHTHHNMIGPHTGPNERTSTRGQDKTRRRTGHSVIFVFKKSRGRREGRPKKFLQNSAEVQVQYETAGSSENDVAASTRTWRTHAHDCVLATRRVDFRSNGLTKH
jgi:hypothetical protein